ncbi:hypothetical protein Tco_1145148 [Tanacetum coccineum]
MFIDSQFTLDYDSQMIDKYFTEYTRIEVIQFRETLLQHMSNVKKSVAERTRHKRMYDRRMNKKKMQTSNADLVVTESSRTESEVQDISSRSGNDTDNDDAEIRPIYNEEPMVGVDQYTEECQVISPLLDSSPDNQTTEYSKQSLESEYILLKKTVAQFQKDFSRMEAHCNALELKYQNHALKSGQHGQILNESSNKAKIKKEIDAYEMINIELEHSVTKLLTVNEHLNKENETLKKHYNDLYIIQCQARKSQSVVAEKADILETSVTVDSQIMKQNDDSSAVTTADASDTRQQEPDSTSSTPTLATTITADGNFDL